MPVDAITSNSQSPVMANGFAAMDSSEFVRVLISELRNQDPFNPQDSAALLEQLSSLRSIESQTLLGDQMATLTSQFTTLFKQNQLASAGNLVGKYIEGVDPKTNDKIYGLVTGVRITNDGVNLELDNGSAININNVVKIANAPWEVTG